MGFEQLTFSFAYLLTYLHSLPAKWLRLVPIGQQPSMRRCICKCDLTGYEMEICCPARLGLNSILNSTAGVVVLDISRHVQLS